MELSKIHNPSGNITIEQSDREQKHPRHIEEKESKHRKKK